MPTNDISQVETISPSSQELIEFRKLVDENRKYTDGFPHSRSKLTDTLGQLALWFVESIDYKSIVILRNEHDFDKLVTLIRENHIDSIPVLFQSREQYLVPPLASGVESVYQSILHEMLVRAVRHEEIREDRKFGTMSIPVLDFYVYHMHLEMYKKEAEMQEAREKEEDDRLIANYGDALERNANVDCDKETMTHLAAAQKARVLRNAISAINKVGYLGRDTQFSNSRPYIIDEPIIWRKADLGLATAFFSSHSNLCVSNIMLTIRRCLEVRYSIFQPGDGYDPHWHARRGDDLGFLLRNYNKILIQLEVPAGA